MLESLPTGLSGPWSLFADWCKATDNEPMPVSREALSRFFEQCPCAPATRAKRLRAIRLAHQLSGFPDPTPARGAGDTPALRTGDDWHDADEALRRCPRRGNAGLHGRRDALLLVLREAGVGKRCIRALTPADVDLGRWTVSGKPVCATDDSLTCRRCVLIRWLDVLASLPPVGFRGDVQRVLELALPAAHVCERGPLRQTWRRAWALIPSVDQHWWASDRGLAARTVSDITARRQTLSAPPVHEQRDRDHTLAREWVGLREARDELDDLLVQLEGGLTDLDSLAGEAIRRDQDDELSVD